MLLLLFLLLLLLLLLPSFFGSSPWIVFSPVVVVVIVVVKAFFAQQEEFPFLLAFSRLQQLVCSPLRTQHLSSVNSICCILSTCIFDEAKQGLFVA